MGTEEMNLGPGKLYITNQKTGATEEVFCENGILFMPKKLDLSIKKMSRKRLVKQLMSRGFDRNTANKAAEFCRWEKRSYYSFAFPSWKRRRP